MVLAGGPLASPQAEQQGPHCMGGQVSSQEHEVHSGSCWGTWDRGLPVQGVGSLSSPHTAHIRFMVTCRVSH